MGTRVSSVMTCTWSHASLFPPSFLLHYKDGKIMKCCWLTHTWRRVISTWVRCSTKSCWPARGLLGRLYRRYFSTGVLTYCSGPGAHFPQPPHILHFSVTVSEHTSEFMWVICLPIIEPLFEENGLCAMDPVPLAALFQGNTSLIHMYWDPFTG